MRETEASLAFVALRLRSGRRERYFQFLIGIMACVKMYVVGIIECVPASEGMAGRCNRRCSSCSSSTSSNTAATFCSGVLHKNTTRDVNVNIETRPIAWRTG